MSYIRPSTDMENIGLEVKRVVAVEMVDMEFVASRARVEVERMQSDLFGRLAYRLRSEVLSERLDPIVRSESIEVPSTWWDHFKQEQVDATSPLWRWVARRWPPRTTTRTISVTVSREALYPNAHIALPERDFGRPVYVAVQR